MRRRGGGVGEGKKERKRKREKPRQNRVNPPQDYNMNVITLLLGKYDLTFQC